MNERQSVLIVQEMACTHDSQGNPRRAWVVSRADIGQGLWSQRLAVHDAEYSISTGEGALRASGIDPMTVEWVQVARAHITGSEYRELIEAGDRLNPRNPWRVVWTDDGTHYAFARNESHARKIAKEYNHPYRNDERPERVRAERNEA